MTVFERDTSVRDRRYWLAVLCALLATAATFADGVDAEPGSESSLLTLPITAPLDAPERTHEPTDLAALLAGIPQEIVDFRAGPNMGEWQVVVYFDAPLATADGMRKSALLLKRQAEALLDLGTVEILLADPQPRTLLTPSNDARAIREALRDVRTEAVTVGELAWHRLRFEEAARSQTDPRSSTALEQELRLLEQQRAALLCALKDRASPRPRLLILVSNGYDLNPRAFYEQATGRSFLEDPRSDLRPSEVARALAADGWTTLTVALGPRSDSFSDPFAPLLELSKATGGKLLTRRTEILNALDEAKRWPLATVRLHGSPDPAPFELVAGSKRHRLDSLRWASGESGSVVAHMIEKRPTLAARAAELEDSHPPVLRLLRPEGLTLSGSVRFRTVSGRQRIDRVAFLLDDEPVAESLRAPFSAVIDLGREVRPCSLTAIAYSHAGRELGRDSLELNKGLEPARVTIDELVHDADSGLLELTANATAPSGDAPTSFDVYVNDQHVASFDGPPFREPIGLERIDPIDVVSVVARYADGQRVEAAKLAGGGPMEQLEVNFVELLAMVTPRGRQSSADLERTDFILRQRGRPRPIDQFSRWEELPLTLGLMLDTSDSMTETLDDVREAGERFFKDALRPGDEAFVVDFNSLPRLVRHTTDNSDLLLDSLQSLDAAGMTALYDAVVFSLQQFKESSGRRALVVVTDGEDSASYYQPRECVRQARINGVPIYLIVLGSPPDPHRDPSLLRNQMIALRTGGEVFYVSDLDDLAEIYERIASQLRRQYFLGFNAHHTLTPEELEEIEIEVVRKGLAVRTLLASQQRGG